MISESELVRDILNSISTIEFRTDQPGENRFLLKQRAAWFVWSTSMKDQRAIGPFKAAWKDQNGGIWLETAKIDDMIEMVEREYGEKGIHLLPDAPLGVVPDELMPAEVRKFPRVVTTLEQCKKRVAEISEKSGVPLKAFFDGGGGVTAFRIGAKIESPPADAEALKLKIIIAATVLKVAYKEVCDVLWPPEDPV